MLFVCNRFADCLGIPGKLFINISNDSLIQLVKQNPSLNRCCISAVINQNAVVVNY